MSCRHHAEIIACAGNSLDSPASSTGSSWQIGSPKSAGCASRHYGAVPNSAFDLDEPIIDEIVQTLPAGDALDAACGTGRWAERLAARGHRVIGVDSSPEMLGHAWDRVPHAEFRLGTLHPLPVGDDAVDLVTCTLALIHVAALAPVMAEFARVLRPGGHLVISDIHPSGSCAARFLQRARRMANPHASPPIGTWWGTTCARRSRSGWSSTAARSRLRQPHNMDRTGTCSREPLGRGNSGHGVWRTSYPTRLEPPTPMCPQ
ncbi:MAG TPA: class I SAM-dependent methyltransferase [Pseudonocardiaceae bacterium]|nr:class I SAM-dependent methyltransferase [Pseudonocardiaceae bacterium]